MSIAVIAVVGALFAVLGAAAERLASVWPAHGAGHRPPGVRTGLLAAVSGAGAAAVTARSTLPGWALAVYLLLLGLLVVLVATDLEQRRLPHLLLDPLIVIGALFIPFNPAVTPLAAVVGGVAAVAFLGLLTLVVRGGLARGDLYLVLPLGFMLGFPLVFTALFAAAFLSAGVSIFLLARRKVGMKTYIPFGPFLVAGTMIALILDDRVLSAVR